MQNEWWKQPALQKSEAVLLPALERRTYSEYRFPNRFLHFSMPQDAFQPVTEAWPAPETTALSTYVRPRGSMAGRSVLRAAGVNASPFGTHRRCAPFRTGRMQTSSRRFR